MNRRCQPKNRRKREECGLRAQSQSVAGICAGAAVAVSPAQRLYWRCPPPPNATFFDIPPPPPGHDFRAAATRAQALWNAGPVSGEHVHTRCVGAMMQRYCILAGAHRRKSGVILSNGCLASIVYKMSCSESEQLCTAVYIC